jgi:mannose-6-phosphate isomerase-like protein (cupin superfamily)
MSSQVANNEERGAGKKLRGRGTWFATFSCLDAGSVISSSQLQRLVAPFEKLWRRTTGRRAHSRLVAGWILVTLISGPAAVTSVWLLAAAAAGAGFVVLPRDAPRFSGPEGREADVTELLATRDQTGGAVGLFRQTVAPRSGPPTHVHRTEDEFFYVVSGEFKVKLGDRVMSAPAQSVMFVPRGTAHTFQNVGRKPGVLLVGVTPAGFEKMFEERQGVDAETNRALMKKHNMEVVGPPLQ